MRGGVAILRGALVRLGVRDERVDMVVSSVKGM
jgi:hypothetical protein